MLDRIPNPPAGMYRDCTPIRVGDTRGPIVNCDATTDVGEPAVLWCSTESAGVVYCDPIASIALDLTDATGRAHLAAWIRAQALASGVRFVGLDIQALCKAAEFAHMTPTEIDLLARLALRIMGRTP